MSGRSNLLENLCEDLRRMGIRATLLDFNDPEAIGGKITYLYTAYDPYEGILHLGSMKIEGQFINQLQVFTRQIPGDISGFRWYDLHFLIRENPKEREKSVTTDCRFKSVLLGKRDIEWTGGSLAKRLNSDEELKKMFLRLGCPNRIRPDNQYGCIRVIVQMSREESNDPQRLISKAMECFPACEKMAQQIREELGS